MTTLTEHVEKLLEIVKTNETGEDVTLFIMAIKNSNGENSCNFYGKPEFAPVINALEALKHRIYNQLISEGFCDYLPFGEEI